MSQNVRAFVVCGFFILIKNDLKESAENMKKIVGAVWEQPPK